MKTLEEFIVLFSELLEETNPNEIQSNTEYKELDDWSSIVALDVIGMVDEEFGVAIKGEDIRNTNTIEELYNTIISKA